jgi:hypothetical protein
VSVSGRIAATASVAAAAVLVLALAACTYRPGADNPVARSMTWFSYAGAGDVRSACRPGAADRFRLIYNGDYDEQVRSYDITALASSAGAMFEARVREQADLSRALSLGDPFGPWREQGKLVRLGPDQTAELRRALVDSGLLRPAPKRLRLDSNGFYWLASVCLDGRFTVNAWKYPSSRFKALSFPAVLLRHDPTGIEVNPPHPAEQYPEQAFNRFVEDGFELMLDGNRLLGGEAFFGN